MTLTHPWPAGDGAALSVLRLVFGSAMVVALVLGVRGAAAARPLAVAEWALRRPGASRCQRTSFTLNAKVPSAP